MVAKHGQNQNIRKKTENFRKQSMEKNMWTYHRRNNRELEEKTQQRAVRYVETSTSYKFYQEPMVMTYNEKRRGRNSQNSIRMETSSEKVDERSKRKPKDLGSGYL